MWTATALASEARAAKGVIWRVVEDQHRASTRKLVDTIEEHDLLEELLDQDKPPYPAEMDELHYLLKTPFRYHPPSPFGSRFRRPLSDAGVFYASEEIRTALAELAYWRLKFFRDAPDAVLPRHEERLTVFSVRYATQHQLDLTQAPLNKDRKRWTHPEDYNETQTLADRAREPGIDAIRYVTSLCATSNAVPTLRCSRRARSSARGHSHNRRGISISPRWKSISRAPTHAAHEIAGSFR